ncbi:DNA-binding protein [Lutibacter sp. A64]|nr:DNA-binding protein [Lutibacter sp. A64]
MQAVNTGTINLNQISYEISNECSLSAIDVKFVLMALGGKLKQHLEEGQIVDLENIGKFKIGFKCKANEDPKKLTPKRSILKYHLNFQPCIELKRWLKQGIKTYKEGSRSR